MTLWHFNLHYMATGLHIYMYIYIYLRAVGLACVLAYAYSSDSQPSSVKAMRLQRRDGVQIPDCENLPADTWKFHFIRLFKEPSQNNNSHQFLSPKKQMQEGNVSFVFKFKNRKCDIQNWNTSSIIEIFLRFEFRYRYLLK